MLCFNYIANIIKFGICWDDGHVGICGDMRDGPPPRNRAGRAAVFDPAPPAHEDWEIGTANDQQTEKKNAYFSFKLLIINDINQYF